jgi:hypothetical protein
MLRNMFIYLYIIESDKALGILTLEPHSIGRAGVVQFVPVSNTVKNISRTMLGDIKNWNSVVKDKIKN